MPARRVAILLTLTLVAAFLVVLRVTLDRPAAGSGGWVVLAWPESPSVLELRTMRVVAAVIVGVALAVSGTILQCLLRNPLAAPDLIGVSPAASLAVVLVSTFAGGSAGMAAGGGLGVLGWQAGPALVGAMAGLGLVYALSQRRGWVDPVSMVLVGVIVGVLCGAAVVAIQAVLPNAALGGVRVLIGAISDDHSAATLAATGIAALVVVLGTARFGPALDAMSLGDDEAASVGVAVRGLRLAMFVGAGVLAACAVVLAGPLGFVGLIAPHAARLLCGPAHRTLVIGAAVCGACLVLAGDCIVRIVDTPGGRLPLGVVMAAAGGPVIILLLRRHPMRE
ncbi:MAG: FecCD family ABC transporter permease [Phycisphaerales bacterium]